MVNWLNYKFFIATTIGFGIFLSSFQQKISTEKKWGFFGHKRINRVAVFTLPPDMFGFYKEHIEYLTEHAPDPDKRRYAMEGEAECHYLDLDHYYKPGEDYTTCMPRQWKDAVAKYTEDTLRAYGIVPWHIEKMKFRLQKAFEAKDVDRILKLSADIGHYIGDAHVPLHTTENYNGIMTGQRGIHGLWESRIVEINAESYDYFIGKAKYVDNVLEYSWQTVFTSHAALDSVFRFEKEVTRSFSDDQKYSYEQRGRSTIKVYSREFCDAYNKAMNGMVERRLRQAIISIGSIWYSAWVDAGQPNLNLLKGKPISQSLEDQTEDLHDHYEGKAKGRICD